MNPSHPTPGGNARSNPLLIAAAIAVILFCLVGTAAILGWIPSSIGGNARGSLADEDRAALAARLHEEAQRGSSGTAGLTASGVGTLAAPLPPAALPAPVPQNALRDEPGALARDSGPAGRADERLAYNEPVRERSAASREREAVQVAESKPAKPACKSCGYVTSIRAIKTRAQGSGVGAGAGAVIGGLLGNQVGGGSGKQIATVAGAVGGAVVGNQVEGNMRATTSYEITVRLDNGKVRTFHQQSAPRWSEGDRVKVVKGSLRPA
jgi:outer membrane lipoprotein SlyB